MPKSVDGYSSFDPSSTPTCRSFDHGVPVLVEKEKEHVGLGFDVLLVQLVLAVDSIGFVKVLSNFMGYKMTADLCFHSTEALLLCVQVYMQFFYFLIF